MGALREKMIEEMKLRNFASRTQKSYVAAVSCRVYQAGPNGIPREKNSNAGQPFSLFYRPSTHRCGG